MSRTFRRRKDILPDVYKEFTPLRSDGFGWFGWYYKTLEGVALKKAVREYHKDGKRTYGWSAPKWHRKITTSVQRMHDKTEIIKFQKDVEYDPMVFAKIPMAYWT